MFVTGIDIVTDSLTSGTKTAHLTRYTANYILFPQISSILSVANIFKSICGICP